MLEVIDVKKIKLIKIYGKSSKVSIIIFTEPQQKTK